MTETDKLKGKIMEEFLFLEEKKNIQFNEDSNFPKEIFAAQSLNELIEIRNSLHYNSCLALFSSCEEIINYYSKLFVDTTKYNDELSDFAEDIDKINKKGFGENHQEYQKIFNMLWLLNRKLKQNRNNFQKQSRWKLITKISPVWVSIISIFYGAIITILIEKDKINFSYHLILIWIGILIVVIFLLRLIIYPLKSPFKE